MDKTRDRPTRQKAAWPAFNEAPAMKRKISIRLPEVIAEPLEAAAAGPGNAAGLMRPKSD